MVVHHIIPFQRALSMRRPPVTHLAFDIFQEGAASGGDIRHLIGHPKLVDSGQGVATRRLMSNPRWPQSPRPAHARAACKGLLLKNAERAVPQNGRSALYTLCDRRSRLRAYIQNHVVVCYLSGPFHHSAVSLLNTRRHHDINRQRDVDAVHQRPRGLNQIPFTQRPAHGVPGSRQERIRDAAAHHKTVAALGHVFPGPSI